jgi:hypothetical protein
MNIGSGYGGSAQAKGWVDEVETFNYPLSPDDILANYNAALALDSDHDGLTNFEEVSGSKTDCHYGQSFPMLAENLDGFARKANCFCASNCAGAGVFW